jgi:hypothetical protein
MEQKQDDAGHVYQRHATAAGIRNFFFFPKQITDTKRPVVTLKIT